MSVDFSNVNIPFMSPNKIEEMADSFRVSHWGNSTPVNVDVIIEKHLKMDLRPYLGLEKLIGLLAFMPADQTYILYDYDQSEERIRYSIAHELGHFVLHKEEIKHLRPNSIEEWKELILTMPSTLLSKVETQANIFASYLLIPKTNLIEQLNFIRNDIELAISQVGKEDYDTLIDFIIPSISKKFVVTRKAMFYRLKNFKTHAIV